MRGFNSIQVQLKEGAIFPPCRRCKQFQFHIGPIKSLKINVLVFNVSGFNSIQVQLKANFWTVIGQPNRRFNSIQVQLKVHRTCSAFWRPPPFQFHIGPIKSFQKFIFVKNLIKFQFHIGPIKSCHCPATPAVVPRVSIPYRSN